MKLKNAAVQKKEKKKTHKVTFNFCELVGFALRLLLDCTEDLFDQSPIELSWRIAYSKLSFKRSYIHIYIYIFFETIISILKNIILLQCLS